MDSSTTPAHRHSPAHARSRPSKSLGGRCHDLWRLVPSAVILVVVTGAALGGVWLGPLRAHASGPAHSTPVRAIPKTPPSTTITTVPASTTTPVAPRSIRRPLAPTPPSTPAPGCSP